MPRRHRPPTRLKTLRSTLGMTQADLADRAGIARTSITAIEGRRLVPSVAAALAIAKALGCTVEELFGESSSSNSAEVWAWEPTESHVPCWQAEVFGKTVRYPSTAAPMLALPPDCRGDETPSANAGVTSDTLVLACCDPAAGLLASLYHQVTGLRLLIVQRSSRQSLEMLRAGLVHMAGLHLATHDQPDGNADAAGSVLGSAIELVRIARWQEGVALSQTASQRSVRGVMSARLTWIGREVGSGARQCLDRLLQGRRAPRCSARNHQGVAEAVRSGWADAGVCLQLVSAEAGLRFLPVQEEDYDICFPTTLSGDRRIKAFLSVIRSKAYRRLIGELPGYDSSDTGSTRIA